MTVMREGNNTSGSQGFFDGYDAVWSVSVAFLMVVTTQKKVIFVCLAMRTSNLPQDIGWNG